MDNIGLALNHAMQTAEEFRSFKELGLLPPLTEISAFEFTCLEAAENAIRQVNNEQMNKANKPKKQELPSGIGDVKSNRIGGPGKRKPKEKPAS